MLQKIIIYNFFIKLFPKNFKKLSLNYYFLQNIFVLQLLLHCKTIVYYCVIINGDINMKHFCISVVTLNINPLLQK